MTYQELVNRIQTIVNNHYQLADFGYGDLSDLKTRFENSSGDSAVQADYPYLFLNPGVHNRNLTTMTYNFNMLVMDMARGEVADQPYNNILAIQSQCQQMIDDVLADLYYGFTDQPEVMRANMSYTPFNERFQDDVAGMTASLSIEVPTGLNLCVAPIQQYRLQADVTTNIERTLGPEDGEDSVFVYETYIYNPNNNWDINRYNGDEPGTYKFVMNQAITLNQPAPGEAIPVQPVILQLTDTPIDPLIPATTASGWPTQFVNTSTVYNFSAEWIIEVPDRRPGGYVWEFLSVQNQPGPESTLQQLPGGTVKIYRLS